MKFKFISTLSISMLVFFPFFVVGCSTSVEGFAWTKKEVLNLKQRNKKSNSKFLPISETLDVNSANQEWNNFYKNGVIINDKLNIGGNSNRMYYNTAALALQIIEEVALTWNSHFYDLEFQEFFVGDMFYHRRTSVDENLESTKYGRQFRIKLNFSNRNNQEQVFSFASEVGSGQNFTEIIYEEPIIIQDANNDLVASYRLKKIPYIYSYKNNQLTKELLIPKNESDREDIIQNDYWKYVLNRKVDFYLDRDDFFYNLQKQVEKPINLYRINGNNQVEISEKLNDYYLNNFQNDSINSQQHIVQELIYIIWQIMKEITPNLIFNETIFKQLLFENFVFSNLTFEIPPKSNQIQNYTATISFKINLRYTFENNTYLINLSKINSNLKNNFSPTIKKINDKLISGVMIDNLNLSYQINNKPEISTDISGSKFNDYFLNEWKI